MLPEITGRRLSRHSPATFPAILPLLFEHIGKYHLTVVTDPDDGISNKGGEAMEKVQPQTDKPKKLGDKVKKYKSYDRLQG
ncbi:hypothetical protein [Streptomyces sp. NPDC057052]|uniref:hypothetical protein n=1 Tax=Streptomyces sp. NPDC057052 TaxID=3346010 RepID=UPI00362DAB08